MHNLARLFIRAFFLTWIILFGYFMSNRCLSAEISGDLMIAIAKVESNFDTKAIGPKGEIGLYQIKLSTARWLGCAKTKKQLLDPYINTNCAYLYLNYLLARSPDLNTALRSYNVGPNRKMRKSAKNHPYVKKVLKALKSI
jgi:soluble lytic murein transglycosylase-like protein